MEKKPRQFEEEVQELHAQYKGIENQKSDLCVNSDGQLCEILELGTATFIHVFNSIRNCEWAKLIFSFNMNFFSKEQGW